MKSARRLVLAVLALIFFSWFCASAPEVIAADDLAAKLQSVLANGPETKF